MRTSRSRLSSLTVPRVVTQEAAEAPGRMFSLPGETPVTSPRASQMLGPGDTSKGIVLTLEKSTG